MTTLALLVSIALSTASLVWGYIGVGLPQMARGLAVFGVFWLLAASRHWRWFSYVGLVVYFLAAALGLWFLNFPPGWMFGGAILALFAWDLTHFQHRQIYAATDAERRAVEVRHLLRLSLLAIFGFALASVAMILQLRFTFDWIAFVTVIVMLGVAQILRWFRRPP